MKFRDYEAKKSLPLWVVDNIVEGDIMITGVAVSYTSKDGRNENHDWTVFSILQSLAISHLLFVLPIMQIALQCLFDGVLADHAMPKPCETSRGKLLHQRL